METSVSLLGRLAGRPTDADWRRLFDLYEPLLRASLARAGVADCDADVHDGEPSTLHVLGLVDGVPAGAVRLFPLDGPGQWQGDRLAVLPPFRAAGLGAPLVRFAVATAGALGGTRMIAHVQPANEGFFRRLGWQRRGEPELYVGIPHLLMDIDLRPGLPGA
jgi:putative N-acetyltransferase (TIGR04045 family)